MKERKLTRKRIANAEKQMDRAAELERYARLGGAQFGDHRPLTHKPFARLRLLAAACSAGTIRF